jgi:glutamate---cysteine ligase / carboxylate-amine ligase
MTRESVQGCGRSATVTATTPIRLSHPGDTVAAMTQPQLATSGKAVPVRAHRFGTGREYTVGIEEELMLVDQGELALVSGVERVLERVVDDRIKRELMQCQIEIASSPQRFIGDALDELLTLRSRVTHAAALSGMRVGASGTHPFSHSESQRYTARDRYRELAAELRYPLRREACFGMHVHVAVGGSDKAMQVIEALLTDTPMLLALSASSPFWRGEPTGLYSTRTIVFQSLPRSGLPPAFDRYDDFARAVERLQRAGALRDHSYLWWDVRPHPRFGTIELRSLDVQPRAEDSTAIAGLVQSLVRHYGRRYDRGERFARADRFVVAENRWLAARHGLHAPLLDARIDATVPARRALEDLIDRVADDAAALHATGALERVSTIISEGTSADRQLSVHRRSGSLADVVSSLVEETSRSAMGS